MADLSISEFDAPGELPPGLVPLCWSEGDTIMCDVSDYLDASMFSQIAGKDVHVNNIGKGHYEHGSGHGYGHYNDPDNYDIPAAVALPSSGGLLLGAMCIAAIVAIFWKCDDLENIR